MYLEDFPKCLFCLQWSQYATSSGNIEDVRKQFADQSWKFMESRLDGLCDEKDKLEKNDCYPIDLIAWYRTIRKQIHAPVTQM